MKSVKWRSPSNIALIKYWGKSGNQIPANPSLSFSLAHCYTETSVALQPKNGSDTNFQFFLEGQKNSQFDKKIAYFLTNNQKNIDFLSNHQLMIESVNSFPHSSGIASSASGMSALALALASIQHELEGQAASEDSFFRHASSMARLGSGSAARSVFGGFSIWGKHSNIPESHDEYAIPLQADQIDPIFHDFCDSILIVSKGQKKVSSSQGHNLMHQNPYSKLRFEQAQKNILTLLQALKNGDMSTFIEIVEHEALSLHAMMLTSRPYFVLLEPNSLRIIEKITNFREQNQLPLCFTIDAGPNIHLLYPKNVKDEVKIFIEEELIVFCDRNAVVYDHVGPGPVRLY